MKTKENRFGGFTLVEVLASMAVLLILMLALVRVFSESTSAFSKGTTTVNRNASARAAMEIIRQDLEMAVLEPNLAMYKESETFAANHDRIGFITMNMPYENSTNGAYVQVQYYVTNVAHIGYTNWVLKRATRDAGASFNAGIDFMGAETQWWKDQRNFNWNEVIAENVVRFDVWICSKDGENIVNGSPVFGGGNPFDSTVTWLDKGLAWENAAYVDIYLQVTSDEAMKRGNLLLSRGQTEKGYSLLYRESNALMARITPKMWGGVKIWPLPVMN